MRPHLALGVGGQVLHMPELWVVNLRPSLLPGASVCSCLNYQINGGEISARWGGPFLLCQVLLSLLLTQNVRKASLGVVTVSSQRWKSAVITVQGSSAASGRSPSFSLENHPPSSLSQHVQ